MKIYAISDLHLSINSDKPMNIFGPSWDNYLDTIKADWSKKVKKNDVVLIPGDISWAMKLDDAKPDLDYISDLGLGTKIIIRGNHDYWWNTITKMRVFLKEKKFHNIDFIYNQGYVLENYIIAGTRGWNSLEEGQDEKVFNRELIRLETSIKDGLEKAGMGSNLEQNDSIEMSEISKELIVFMHYPPISNSKIFNKEEALFVEIMKKYNVKKCFYGHLHGASIKDAFEGIYEGIEFKLVSADGLNFKLYKI